MLKTNLTLQIIRADSDLSYVFIGESCFLDDVWDLNPFVAIKSLRGSSKLIKFGYIQNADIKLTVKHYAYYKLGQVKPQTVCLYINGFLRPFVEYAAANGIGNFTSITREDFLNFSLWLKNDKKVAVGTGFHFAHVVEDIIKIGQIKGWRVPQDNIFAGLTTNNLWNTSKAFRTSGTKLIPENVFDRILYHVVHDEKDAITKAGIIIMSQTGLRINEVMSIQKGCIHTTFDGYDYMEVMLSKTEKGSPIVHKVFINDLVKNAVRELSDVTEPLRRESGLKELFLIRYGKIKVMTTFSFRQHRLSKFIKRWDIRDSTGELYHLAPHQFRATFVRELIKQKVPIAYIMKQYSHVSIEMTAHYLTLQEREIKEIYSDLILSPESKITGLRAKEIRGKLDDLFRGKTTEEITQIIADLSQTMSFNPLPTGVCLYDFRRGNCTDGNGCFMYNCPNYLTEVRFYPILKAEFDLIEKEMARLKVLGQIPAWQVQYVKWKYLKPLVEDLKTQIEDDAYVR